MVWAVTRLPRFRAVPSCAQSSQQVKSKPSRPCCGLPPLGLFPAPLLRRRRRSFEHDSCDTRYGIDLAYRRVVVRREGHERVMAACHAIIVQSLPRSLGRISRPPALCQIFKVYTGPPCESEFGGRHYACVVGQHVRPSSVIFAGVPPIHGEKHGPCVPPLLFLCVAVVAAFLRLASCFLLDFVPSQVVLLFLSHRNTILITVSSYLHVSTIPFASLPLHTLTRTNEQTVMR